MPAPAAPTGLTLTQTAANQGSATLAWTHAGTTKYQVLYKRPYDDEWKNLYLRNAAVFGAGPYDLEVPLTEGIAYTVKAINSAGETSAAATEVTFSGTVEGTWLLPFDEDEIEHDDQAWIGGRSLE